MPHRVASFFRSSTENITTTAATALKSAATRRRDSSSRSAGTTRPRFSSRDLLADRAHSYASSVSDEGEEGIFAIGMPEITNTSSHSSHGSSAVAPSSNNNTTTHKKHRISLPFGRSSRDSHENASASLDWKIESPPIVFYGDADNSTGALVSGQLFLEVKEDWLEVDVFEASINVHVTHKKPFQTHCTDCANQLTELKKWRFLRQPTTLPRGTHQYPFSILLGGHLPASMETPLCSITYEFKAEAITSRSPTQASAGSCAPIRLEKTLDVRRSLPEPDAPHHSVRVFPPTNIKATTQYDQVVHPAGKHTMSLRLDGLSSTNHKTKTVEHWKLKKVTWRLEETIKTVAPACERHSPAQPTLSAPETQAAKKGVARSETRVLGDKPLFDGWKADYSGDGNVELEIEYGIVAAHRHLAHTPRYAGDSRSRDGTEVSHSLMVEMVVSKEWSPVGKPHLTTQTGTGRILRMHFSVSVSERAGLGVSWDNEAPPLYQDVPPSPPTYPDREGLIDYSNLEPLEAAERTSVEESHA